MKAFKMIVTDIVVKRFGGPLKKLKVIIRVFIYVGVRGCQMIVSKTKRGLRRNGLKYIEKKRMFYKLLSRY